MHTARSYGTPPRTTRSVPRCCSRTTRSGSGSSASSPASGPFHCHRTPYFWVCIDSGRAIQRYPDGHLIHVEFAARDTDFLDEARLETERIHDLENTGTTTFRFHTFELLSS